MSGGPADPGLIQTLIQAGGLGVTVTALGGSIAWIFSRRDKRRADASKERDDARNEGHKDDAEEREERRFLDERSRRELERIERERDEARAECRACNGSRELLLREIMDLRDGWIDCLHEARRCQQLIRSLYQRPPEPGQPPPTFEPLPEPRRRADQA